MPIPMPMPASPAPLPDSARLVASSGQRASDGHEHSYVFDSLPRVTLVNTEQLSAPQASLGSPDGVAGWVAGSIEDSVFRPD